MSYSLASTLELVDELKAAGVSAALDPADINPPGVWVQVVGFEPRTMVTYRTNLRLLLITGDKDARRAIDTLLDLVDQVEPVIGAGRTARARTVLLPDGTRLPGLEILTSVHAPA